jgi:hypothetical protein
VPFSLHASATCPPPAELAIALAWELGDADPDRIERTLAALAAHTRRELAPDARRQLRALGEAPLNARRDGELMIDRVLERRTGHPLAVAIVLTEIGRRAGLPVALVAGDRGHFVAHQRLTEALVLDPATGRLTDANALGKMTWRCGHQVAAELLDILQPRFERTGDLTRALHVARLRTTLPFDDTTGAQQRLRRVIARLN